MRKTAAFPLVKEAAPSGAHVSGLCPVADGSVTHPRSGYSTLRWEIDGSLPEQLGFVRVEYIGTLFSPTHQRPSEWQELSSEKEQTDKTTTSITPEVRKPPQLHVQEGSLGVRKGGECHPVLGSNVTLPLGLA